MLSTLHFNRETEMWMHVKEISVEECLKRWIQFRQVEMTSGTETEKGFWAKGLEPISAAAHRNRGSIQLDGADS